MIEFNVHVARKPFTLDRELRKCFPAPIAYCLLRGGLGLAKTLFCVGVVDFEKGEFIFIELGSEENQRLLERSGLLSTLAGHATPHSFIEVRRDERMLVFVAESSFFCDIDYRAGVARILTGADFEDTLGLKGITYFGTTVYGDSETPGAFYFPVMSRERGLDVYSLYRARKDLSAFEHIITHESQEPLMPHVTRQYKELILSSPFNPVARFVDTRTRERTLGLSAETLWKMFGAIYQEYCSGSALEPTPAAFQALMANRRDYAAFRGFYLSRYGNFEELCLKNHLTLLPEAQVEVLSLVTKEVRIYQAAGPNTAHFEIDPQKDTLFVSNHNFTSVPEWTYFGPGSIDKFSIRKGELFHEGRLSHETAFRLTNHRVFHYRGRAYVVALGHPNRLFFFDAEKMKLEYWDDVGEPVLLRNGNVKKYLNEHFQESCRDAWVPVEAGDNGMLCLFGSRDLCFYDFGERAVKASLPYKPDESYSLYGVHCQYL